MPPRLHREGNRDLAPGDGPYAVKIGLTATTASHTTSYFQDVVYRYEYERAVREGYLVDYDPLTIKSNVRMQGVFLKEGEQVSFVDPETGSKQLDQMEDERQYDTTEIEEKVTSPNSNRKILEEIKKYALEHEKQYGRFPKTLIFAANDLPHTSHADQLVNTARDIFGRDDAFVAKITGSPTVDRPLQRIREFRNRPEPSIVVTVDMLSTGVDIPDLEHVVFLRPVKSRILFEQMIGRGTRKGEHYPDKSHFVVVDCFDGTFLELFWCQVDPRNCELAGLKAISAAHGRAKFRRITGATSHRQNISQLSVSEIVILSFDDRQVEKGKGHRIKTVSKPYQNPICSGHLGCPSSEEQVPQVVENPKDRMER